MQKMSNNEMIAANGGTKVWECNSCSYWIIKSVLNTAQRALGKLVCPNCSNNTWTQKTI